MGEAIRTINMLTISNSTLFLPLEMSRLSRKTVTKSLTNHIRECAVERMEPNGKLEDQEI